MATDSKPKRVAFYVRVSTDGQTVDNQLQVLQEVAERHGWNVVHTFKDEGISGAKGRDKRPGLDALQKGIARKDFDLIAAWSVDRLGRSLQDLIALMNDMKDKSVDLYLHQQGLDTSTAAGRAMFQMLGVFAEFERAMIQDRVKAGLERAKAQGKTLGRPKVADDEKHAAIRQARAEGKTIRAIATEFNITKSSVDRILREGAA